MESEPLQPQFNPEHSDYTPTEQMEKGARESPESGIESGAEHFEQRSESGARSVDGIATTVLPPVANGTTSVTPVVSPTSPVNDTPSIANDDDLIEKEWVDKAKRIILETKDDPYRREQEVGRLQRDYQEKRYGRKIGAADNDN